MRSSSSASGLFIGSSLMIQPLAEKVPSSFDKDIRRIPELLQTVKRNYAQFGTLRLIGICL
jgi:hypothetical protein